jgi:hypothetical protein
MLNTVVLERHGILGGEDEGIDVVTEFGGKARELGGVHLEGGFLSNSLWSSLKPSLILYDYR